MRVQPTPRTELHRKRDRGSHDWEAIVSIPDEGYVAHVGLATASHPVVLPMVYARIDDRLYLHGAPANGALKVALEDRDVCVSVTLVDGLVMSRSAFHHSVNYRSVVLFGRAQRVGEEKEKHRALLAVVDHVMPGRSHECRAPTLEELRATSVVRIPIVEASAKVREGGPIEEPDDLALPYWGGELPLTTSFLPPRPDQWVRAGVESPITRARGA